MTNTFRQVELVSTDNRSKLVCWLPFDHRIRRGVRLTLKQLPGIRWEVEQVYTTEHTQDDLHFTHGWHVGGLD